eukprot:350834-Chlamydomonas_euryale.AAC.3
MQMVKAVQHASSRLAQHADAAHVYVDLLLPSQVSVDSDALATLAAPLVACARWEGVNSIAHVAYGIVCMRAVCVHRV